MEIEVLKGDYGYNPDFSKKDINSQIWDLAVKFNLDPTMAFEYLKNGGGQIKLPDGCHYQDGLYAVLSPFAFKKLLSWDKDSVFDIDLYCKSLIFSLKMVEEMNKISFINYKSDFIKPNFLSQTENCLKGYELLSFEQGESDIWLIKVQLGFFRRGEPASTHFLNNEYGLSSVFMSCIALTHPNFFGDNYGPILSIVCPGDIFYDNTAPNLFSNGSTVMYNSLPIENPYPKVGLATQFI